MKVKCSKCGFEDEGKFCSNCGAPLPWPDFSVEREFPRLPIEVLWLDKCPVCKSGKLLPITKKKLFGLVSTKNYECNGCGATFTQKGEKYQIAKVLDTSNQIWQEYGNQILADKEWRNIAYGGMSDVKQKEADIEYWMTQLKEGNIPIRFGGQSPIILKKKEELIFALPNISLLEPRAVRTGGYGGPSVRLAKGLYFRVGGFKAESHEEVRNIDQGTLTLTNKRLVFSGTKRTININLDKVISVEPYSDGIALRRSGKEKTQYFTNINQSKLTITVSSRVYEESFSGLILMYLIEGLTRQME
jgi:hypothetical protein